jgi:endonuclease YncB( thermonuclease family)
VLNLRERFSVMSALLAGLLAVVAIAPCHAPAETRAAVSKCLHEPLGRGTVASILDGRTVLLADGREVRLAGIEEPQADAHSAASGALRALIEGAEVNLKGPSFFDRYGRLVAYVFVVRGGSEEEGVAQSLLATGVAWVSPTVDTTCAAELFASERLARRDKLGLWGDPYYEIRSADNPDAVSERRGIFTLVEGKVVSVRESGGTIYVNFGRRWSEDFTVTVQKRNERSFADAGLEPKKLEGRRVRVRGWIEKRSGPWIEAQRPAQIEIVDGN